MQKYYKILRMPNSLDNPICISWIDICLWPFIGKDVYLGPWEKIKDETDILCLDPLLLHLFRFIKIQEVHDCPLQHILLTDITWFFTWIETFEYVE